MPSISHLDSKSILHPHSQLTIEDLNGELDDPSEIKKSLEYFQEAFLAELDSKEVRQLIAELKEEQGTDLQSQLSEKLVSMVAEAIELQNDHNPEDKRISKYEINKIVRIYLTTVLDSRKDIDAILSPALA